jgi:hypothetical protein
LLKLTIETKSVFQDLQALQTFDINAFGRAAALIKSLHENQKNRFGQDLIDQLNMQGRSIEFSSKTIGNALRIESERLQRNLWRLKLWRIDDDNRQALEPYRVIYGFFAVDQYRKTPEIRIFAVPIRSRNNEDSYDYRDDDSITIRFRKDYDAYC